MDAKFKPVVMVHGASGHQAQVPEADIEKFRLQGYRVVGEPEATEELAANEDDAPETTEDEDDDAEAVDVDPFTQADRVDATPPRRRSRKK